LFDVQRTRTDAVVTKFMHQVELLREHRQALITAAACVPRNTQALAAV